MKTSSRAASISLTTILVMVAFSASNAYQPDAPFVGQLEKHKQAWETEDQDVDAKLAALEERFGKKPNIVYRLRPKISRGWRGWWRKRGSM